MIESVFPRNDSESVGIFGHQNEDGTEVWVDRF